MHPIIYGTKNHDDYTELHSGLFHDEYDLRRPFEITNDFNKMITWIFITTEENEKGILHFHGIIAYRNILDYNNR